MKYRELIYTKKRTIAFLLVIIFLTTNSILTINPIEQKVNISQPLGIPDYFFNVKNGLPLPYLNISGNANLEYYASAGNGTATDPYIIENVLLDDCPPFCLDVLLNNGPCILIENTNKHFILRNCRLCTNYCDFGYNFGGIDFINVSNAEIFNNSVYNVNYGCIALQNSHNITLKNNTIYYKRLESPCYSYNQIGSGISLYNSSNIRLFNNTISDINGGICLRNSNDNIIINNNIYRNSYGINLFNSSKNTIIYNILIDNRKGLSEDVFSIDNIIENNTISDIKVIWAFQYSILIPTLIALGLARFIYVCFKKGKKCYTLNIK